MREMRGLQEMGDLQGMSEPELYAAPPVLPARALRGVDDGALHAEQVP